MSKKNVPDEETAENSKPETKAVSKEDTERSRPAAKRKKEAPVEGNPESEDREPKAADSVKKAKKSGAVSAAAFYIVAGIAIVALLGLAISIFTGGSIIDAVVGVFRGRTPVERGDVVMTVGDFEVSTDEYLYNILSVRNYYEQSYGADVLPTLPALDAQMKDYVVEEMSFMAAQIAWAEELGIELTAEDKAAIDADIQSLIDEQYAGVREDFIAAINGMFITEDFYYQLSYRNRILQRLADTVYAEDSPYLANVTPQERVAIEEKSGVLSAKHILVVHGETEEEDAEKKTLAESIYDKLINGEDFDTLMNTYSEDPGLAEYPDGYVFYPEEFVPEFTAATQALAYGMVSELVESEHGWHIIMRLEISEHELDDLVCSDRVNTHLNELINSFEIQYARGYDKMTAAGIQWKGDK